MATAAEKRKEAVRLIKSIKGRNSYTQGANRDYVFGKPEGAKKGYGDCSSTVMHVLKRAAGISIGGNTSAQWANAKKGLHGAVIVQKPSGNYFDEGKLEPGDCLYWKGNAAHTDDVGHVEMYIGGGQCMGHGSGTGPTLKTLKSYCAGRTGSRKALGAVRWIKDDTTPPAPAPKLGDRALPYGMVAPDVGELQALLVKLGYDLGTYGPAKNGVDSDYGSKTRDAVKAEQAHIGVAQTGNADLVTIAHIIAHAAGDIIPADPMKPGPSVRQTVLVTGGSVNIRKGPSNNHGILGQVKSGDKYDASGEAADGWIGLMYKGAKAWISAKYAEVVP